MQKELIVDFTEGEGLEKVDIKGKVIFKRLSFYEKNLLEEEMTEVKIIGESPNVKVSTTKLKECSLVKSIVSSELVKTTYYEDKVTKKIMAENINYPLNINNIRDLPQELGEIFFMEFTKLNSLSLKKNVI